MNTNTTISKSTKALHRLLLAGLGSLLAMLAVVSMAGQAHASSYGYAGKVYINSYYGAASGDASINSSQTNFYVGVNLKDVRNDGYCSTLQMRGTSGGSASGWFNVGFNCSTTVSKFVWHSRTTSGWLVDGIQVRACQSDRYGRVVATCSSPVYANNWRVVYG